MDEGPVMSRLLSACAAAVLLAAPAMAQTNRPASSDLRQDQVRPGVLGPGVDAVTPSGETIPGGDAEAKTTGPDANMSKTLGSGASGVANPVDRAIGTNDPGDAYKKDFQKK